MNRIENLTHKGKNIVLVNLANSQPVESVPAVQQAHQLIARQGPKNALVLTDVTQATYDKNVAAGIKDFVSKNTPYIKASAVVGADGVRLVLLQTVIMLSRRQIKTFDQRQQALDWLASKA